MFKVIEFKFNWKPDLFITINSLSLNIQQSDMVDSTYFSNSDRMDMEKLEDATDTLSASIGCGTTLWWSRGEDCRYITSISSPPRITSIPPRDCIVRSSVNIVKKVLWCLLQVCDLAKMLYLPIVIVIEDECVYDLAFGPGFGCRYIVCVTCGHGVGRRYIVCVTCGHGVGRRYIVCVTCGHGVGCRV